MSEQEKQEKEKRAVNDALLEWRDKIDRRYLTHMDSAAVTEERINLVNKHRNI